MTNIPLFSVTELSRSIKISLEKKYEIIRVRGEITGYKEWNGHLLFSLKDETSLISCRIWSNKAHLIDIKLEDGLEVVSTGKISTHMQRSNYNFIIDEIELAGEGALLKVIEKRKEKYKKLGYFDEKNKIKLPYLPYKIGVITSIEGAVIEDIKKRIYERFPSHLIIWPVSVQGKKSEYEVSQAVKGLNNLKIKPDVIIIARGGGSTEDLMPFNSELVLNSIYDSKIPIVSAIGHETDYTLSDFVSDKRASTPTNAADIVVPEHNILSKNISSLLEVLESNTYGYIKKKNYKLDSVFSKIKNPKLIIELAKKKYVSNYVNINIIINNLIANNNMIIKRSYLNNPRNIMENRKKSYVNLEKKYTKAFSRFIFSKIKELNNLNRILETLSYEKILDKGFVILKDKDNKIIKDIEKLKVDDILNIKFLRGKVVAEIKKIQN